jgi:hypothetical protein
MYKVLKIVRLYTLSVKIQLDLFDKMIKPLLLSCMVARSGVLSKMVKKTKMSSLEILQSTFKFGLLL